MFVFDIQQKVLVYTNDRVQSWFGYSPDVLYRSGFAFLDRLVHPDDRSRVFDHFHALLGAKDGEILEIVYRLRCADGDWCGCLSRSMVFARENSGQVVQVLGTITEQKESFEALVASEKRFRALIDASPVGINVLDREGRVTLWSPAAETLYGWKSEEVLGKPLPIIPEARKPFFQEQLKEEILGKARRNMEVQRLRKDGSLVDIQLSTAPLPGVDGQTAGIVAVNVDITEQKHFEEELARMVEIERKRRLEAEILQQATTELVSTLDPQQILTTVMAHLEKIVPFDCANLMILREPELSIMVMPGQENKSHPDADRNSLKGALMQEIIHSGKPLISPDAQQDERFISWREMHPGMHSWMGVPLIDREDIIGLLVLISHQLDAYSELESHLVQVFANQVTVALRNAKLFKQVQAGREQLKVLSQRLVKVQEAERLQLARELHDEIGQTLTGLKLLLKMKPDFSPETVQSRLDEAQNTLNTLIRQVRDLSLNLRPGMLDDLGLLPALLWLFQRFSEQSGIQVDFSHFGVEEQRFLPDVETTVYRLVQEALTNIARYAEVQRASIRIRASGSVMEVEIDDQGKGFLVDSVLRSNQTAGLVGMRERTNLIGGELDIWSLPGIGTHLHAVIPLGKRLERRTHERIDPAGG